MPILRGAATFARFRVDVPGQSPPDFKRTIPKGLRTQSFTPLDRGKPEDRAQGFVELEDVDATEFTPGTVFQSTRALFAYRVDQFKVPSSLVRAELEKWAKNFELENERKPGRKEKSDAKEEIRFTIRQKAPIASKTFDVSWNLDEKRLYVWAASRKAIDEVQAAVEQAFKVKLVELVPSTVATTLRIPEKALTPTKELGLPDQGAEGTDGQA